MSPLRPAQLPMLETKDFALTPTGIEPYIAVLQNRSGELRALGNVDNTTWERLVPLLTVVGPKKLSGALQENTIADWAKKIGQAVGKHACFVDIARLQPTRATQKDNRPSSRSALEVLHRECRRVGVQFVPVLPLGASSQVYMDIVKSSLITDGRGVGLRWNQANFMPTGKSITSSLQGVLSALGTSARHADLILDLGYIDPDGAVDAHNIRDQINELSQVGEWRSLTLLGTTIPSSLGGVPENTIGSLPRMEWHLRQQLQSLAIARQPGFGDYCVQHPKPPEEPGGLGMRANIRYTAAESTTIARGKGAVVQEGREQYRELCQRLVQLPQFSGSQFSWGDGLIADCADFELDPGTQDMWRGAGTSHHLRFVCQQLSA